MSYEFGRPARGALRDTAPRAVPAGPGRTRRVERRPLPAASLGTERALTAFRYGAPGARPKAYLHAGLHADEPPGMLALHYLRDLLDRADEAGAIRGKVVLVPVANPVGMAQHALGRLLGRFDLECGTNFNRRYPDLAAAVADRVAAGLGPDPAANVALIRGALARAAAEAAAPTEADALRRELLALAVDADIVLDVHCDWQAVVHLYVGTPLWPGAADLAAEIGAEVTLLAEDSGGGPFDEACSRPWWALGERFGPERPIPLACLAATVELRGEADVDDALAAADARGLLRFLQRRGAVAGDPGPLPERRGVVAALEGVEMVRAPAAGLVAYHKHPGDRVRAGEAVADLVDPLADASAAARTPVLSRAGGVLFARRSDRIARPGQILCKIAGEAPLPGRTGDLMAP